jgi:hypothetical protein
MSFGYQAQISQTLADANLIPINDRIARTLDRHEYEMLQDLEEIVQRAQGFIAKINEGRADSAALWIADCAGASGPIGSIWEKLIVKSAEFRLLLEIGCEKVVK